MAARRTASLPFIPYGYDERQYCSPGFDMPVGCFMRSPNGGYPEYHSSADNLSLVRPECLAESLDMLWQMVGAIEGNATYLSRSPKGEPQLGKRGLYRPMGGQQAQDFDQMSLLWVLNLADGQPFAARHGRARRPAFREPARRRRRARRGRPHRARRRRIP